MSELAKALLAFQKEAPVLHKGTEGQVGARKYKYLGLDDAMAAIRPALNAHGVIVMQDLGSQAGHRWLSTRLEHAESGEFRLSEIPLPDTDDMQALGSAITYARRYSLIAMLGLVADEDDDGSRAKQSRQAQGNGSEKPQEAFVAPASAAESEGMTPGQKTQIREAIETLEKEMPSTLRPEDWTTTAAEWSREQFALEPGAELNKAQAQRLIVQLEEWLLDEQSARAGAKA